MSNGDVRKGVLKIKRSQLTEYSDHYRQAGAVVPRDADEREDVKRFKFIAGRNDKTLMSEIKRTQKHVDKLTKPTDEYMAYIKERHELQMQYAQKGDDGQILHEQHENGSVNYVLDPETREFAEAKLEELNAKHKDHIDGYRAQVDEADSYMEEYVEIEIRTVPWDIVPSNVTGGYLLALVEMIRDIPEDLLV